MAEAAPRPTGYVTDVPYPRAFIPQIAPTTLRLVAALNGQAPPPEEDFDYCELGCATGDTLATVAAANPRGRFVGIELSAAHVEAGMGRVRRGGLENVTILERDFADPRNATLPSFDFIVAHGVWSWVSPGVRESVLAFVRDRLKPGGLFYLSYNAMPGWAAVAPLRRLMRELVPGAAGARGTLDRARDGVAFAQRLADSGAAYFASHPTAKQMLALVQKGGLAYATHEYFHDDWAPEYFADVARPLATRGLSYLGQVPLYANVKELAIPPSLKTVASSVTDRILLEGLKDYATNELFRSDVYVHGKPTRSIDETRFYFEGTPFGTFAPREQIKRDVRLPFYSLEYTSPLYDAILAVITEHAVTAMQLALRPELAAAGQLRIGDGLLNLSLGGQVVPMWEGAGAAAGPLRVASPYNALVLDEALAEQGPSVFASPVTRGGVHLSLTDALSIRLLTDPVLAPEGYGDALRAYARTRPLPISLGDRKIKDPDELARVMAREVERFVSSALPKLEELGILARAL